MTALAQHVLVALDGSSHDRFLLQQAARWMDCFRGTQLFLLHVMEEEVILPALVESLGQHVAAPSAQALEERMLEQAQALLGKHPFQLEVRSGKNFNLIMKAVQDWGIELLFLGLKNHREGSGLVSHRLANQSPCSLFLVSPKLPLAWHRILVATDFSAHSERAIVQARALASCHGAQVSALHYYHVPSGYLKNAGSHRELMALIEEQSAREKDLAGEEHQQTSCFFRENRGQSEADTLQWAGENAIDLLVLGSKGRTAATAALLGSFAEKLFRLNKDKSLLLVKAPNENLGLLKALGWT